MSNLLFYITAIAPATMASIPPETRLTRPALVVGTADWEAEAELLALVEVEVLVEVSDDVLAVLAVLVVLVAVVAVVMVVIVVMVACDEVLVLVELGSAEVLVVAGAEEVAMGDAEAEAVAPATVKRGRKL